ncbi:NACHT domain-containing NTPase [Emticicia oligotrophica]|uniref:NACHT domain-containing protein n=1 Tax=Emticicia oligotrophica TaxID=312279 RepID=UPI00273B6EFA|nr:hypothetical protein [Emticicia oligotrophica]
MTTSILITTLITIIFFLYLYIWYLKIFKKYTRERFAFVGLTTIFCLISTLTLQIYSSQGVLNAVVDVSNFYLDTHISTNKTDYRDHLLVSILIFILISFIYKIHSNWNGPISTIAAEKMRFSGSTMFEEFLLQFQDFFRSKQNKKIIPHRADDIETKYSVFSINDFDKSPWFEEVYELFTLRSNQYNINIKKDFYEEENCFVSKYGHNKEAIAIFCSLSYPTQTELDKFLRFISSLNKKFTKIIVAIKNVKGDQAVKNINGKSIEFRYENEMLDSLVDFKYYHDYINELFTVKPITENSKITIKDFYVDLRAKTEKIENIENIENYALEWSESKENKHLAILGEYGCGKSVFSLKLAYELLKKNGRIPIIFELRGKSPRNLSMIELISTWSSAFRIDPLALLKLHREGKLVLIFEGFDEMDMVGDREVRFLHFQKLWEFATPNSKIIITGRPNFFLDDKELKTNLGIDKPYETSHYCEAVYLEKFDKNQIEKAMRKVENETRKQVLSILNSNSKGSNFYDLVSRPAILYLVSVIWKERKLSEVKERINSAIIIGEFIQYCYSRQTDKKAQFPLTEHEREYFMLGVAVGMHRLTELSNQISKNDLEEIILKLYKDFPEDLLPVKNATQQYKNPLKERMKDNNNAEEMILTDVRSCGILVNDLGRKDFFKFAHKSFYEYLVSLFFVESVLKENNLAYSNVRSISKSLEVVLSNFEHSKETMTFTAEILASRLKLSVTPNSKETAYSLFETLYPIKFLSKFPKIAGMLEVYSYPKISFSLMLSTSLLTMIMFFTLLISKSNPIFDELSITNTTILTFPIFFATLMMLFYKTFTRNNGLKRSQIWLNCCNQLNIDESITSKMVPQEFFKMLKGENPQNVYLVFRNILYRSLKNRIIKK